MTIINYASCVINKLEALLTDDARVVIYDHHEFIIQATELFSVHVIMTLKSFMKHFKAVNNSMP